MEQHSARRSPRVLASLVFGLSALIVPSLSSAEGHRPTGSPEELLVRFHAGVGRSAAKGFVRKAGAEPIDELGALRIHRIRAPKGQGTSVAERLGRRPDVEFVEHDDAVPPAEVPNDTDYANEWHLPKINAPAAWDVTHGSSSIVIAILDSGVDSAHPDLAPKMVPGWNFYDNNADTSDVYGHGTKVAGVAAAVTNNATGVAGVGWSSSVMPIRVTDTAGSGYLSAMASGINWAVDHGARVVNLSFESMAGSSTIRTAAQYAMSKGAVVVAAAGNCGCDDATPENPYLVSVGGTDTQDALKTFSARGAFVDVVAPGVMLETTARGGTYVYVAGTSYASPVVAGLVSLMMAVNSGASPDQLVAWLESTAVDLGAAGHDSSFGFGRIDASLAVTAAAANPTPPPSDTTRPSASITSPGAGSTVSGIVSIAANALDDRAVAKVELWIDGQLFASDSTAPYTFAWSSTTVVDGAHSLVAVAQDTSGNRGSSAGVSVTVSNQTDSSPPVALIATPTAGAALSRTATIKATATDDVGLASLDVMVDGQWLGGGSCSGTTCEVSLKWNLKPVGKGAHTLTARAVDRSGKSVISGGVAVTVR